MTQVRVTNPSGGKWAVIAGVVVALGAAGFWFAGSDEGTDATRVTEEAGASAPVGGASSGVVDNVFAKTEPSEQEAKAVLAQQKEAAQVIEAKPDMKPLVGPITERPDFVSPMEWAMLQGVVQQHANPDKELTRMVNFLRFMKQMEALDALPKTAVNASKRQVLTAQLIEDLPNRVKGGDLDIKDAQARLAEWLPEAVPDAQQRQARADVLNARMTEAAEAHAAAEAADMAAKQRQ